MNTNPPTLEAWLVANQKVSQVVRLDDVFGHLMDAGCLKLMFGWRSRSDLPSSLLAHLHEDDPEIPHYPEYIYNPETGAWMGIYSATRTMKVYFHPKFAEDGRSVTFKPSLATLGVGGEGMRAHPWSGEDSSIQDQALNLMGIVPTIVELPYHVYVCQGRHYFLWEIWKQIVQNAEALPNTALFRKLGRLIQEIQENETWLLT